MLGRTVEKVDECISFIARNADFFVALLNDSNSVKSAIEAERNRSSLLINGMYNAFTTDIYNTMWCSVASFRSAICGDVRVGSDEGNGLIHGSNKMLRVYLYQNPQMIDAILNNQNDPIIAAWRTKSHIPTKRELEEKQIEPTTVTVKSTLIFARGRPPVSHQSDEGQAVNQTDQILHDEKKSQSRNGRRCGIAACGLFAASVVVVAVSVAAAGMTLVNK